MNLFVLSALRENTAWWSLNWISSHRGGRETFERDWEHNVTCTRCGQKIDPMGMYCRNSRGSYHVDCPEPTEKKKAMPRITLAEFILACHYLYYVKGRPCLEDYPYDQLERAALRLEPGLKDLPGFGSDCERDYTERVREIAGRLSAT